jgi:hypothetical protein
VEERDGEMIKAYLVFLAVTYGLIWNNIYAAPKHVLTTQELIQQAREKSKAKVCARIKKGTRHDRICGIDKNILLVRPKVSTKTKGRW